MMDEWVFIILINSSKKLILIEPSMAYALCPRNYRYHTCKVAMRASELLGRITLNYECLLP